MMLKGIGLNGAWLFVMECFGWGEFKNCREVEGLAGLTPTPYQSGESAREQGITKSDNRHVRWMMTELARGWLRNQPDSALSVWFRERFGGGGKRLRRIGVVAVARKLSTGSCKSVVQSTGLLSAAAGACMIAAWQINRIMLPELRPRIEKGTDTWHSP